MKGCTVLKLEQIEALPGTYYAWVFHASGGNGEDVKVVQESRRHANSQITLDTYTQALTPAKRKVQTKVVRMILPELTQTAAAGAGE